MAGFQTRDFSLPSLLFQTSSVFLPPHQRHQSRLPNAIMTVKFDVDKRQYMLFLKLCYTDIEYAGLAKTFNYCYEGDLSDTALEKFPPEYHVIGQGRKLPSLNVQSGPDFPQHLRGQCPNSSPGYPIPYNARWCSECIVRAFQVRCSVHQRLSLSLSLLTTLV
ncbi:hypothetical protein XPA_009581 [Xanthoria parietina]